MYFARTNFNRVETLSKDAERFFDIFEHIQKVTDEYYYLNRIDFNLQHSFCDGSFHLDGHDDNHYTIMYWQTILGTQKNGVDSFNYVIKNLM